MSILLPHPVDRLTPPWLAVVATPLVLTTDSLAHAGLTVIIVALALALLHLTARVSRGAHEELRDCLVLLIGAGFATCVDLVLLAYAFPVYRSLPLLVPIVLIVMFVHSSHARAADDRAAVGYLQLLIGLLLLGVGREIVGHGSLLHDVPSRIATTLFPPEMGFFLAALAPGAFIALGILLAAIQWLRRHHQSR